MRYDTVVIGGGLAGFAAGLALLEAGRSCALINTGQSALHFSSGSFDFLNALPDGTAVDQPRAALPSLATQAPHHPYTLLGPERTVALGKRAEDAMRRWDIPMIGGLERGNRTRATPLGRLVRTWLTACDALGSDSGARLPWDRILIATIDGFLDFYPEILAGHLADAGHQVDLATLHIAALEPVRRNPSEFRSVNIARVLDRPETLVVVGDKLADMAAACDALLLPACIGHQSLAPIETLEDRLKKPVRLIPTLPPSLIGARINRSLMRRFASLGGVYMPGDTLTGFEQRGDRIHTLRTRHHEDIPLEPAAVILASGSFFSDGLTAHQTGIRERIFGLDLLDVPENRGAWTAQSTFDPQPYAGYGVRTDADFRGFINGTPMRNLYVAGMVLGGFDPVRLGCGAGTALVSAFAAVDALLQSSGAAR